MNSNFIHLLEGFQSCQNRTLSSFTPGVSKKKFNPMRFFSKMRKYSCSVCFYITALSSNTFQTDVLEVLSFFGRKISFHPILLFGFSVLKDFSLRINRSKSQFMTGVYQPSFLFSVKFPFTPPPSHC